jgi:hypothetical protein
MLNINDFAVFISGNWFAILAVLLALFSFIRTVRWKRRLTIELNTLIDGFNSFIEYIESSDVNIDLCIKDRISSINRQVTCLISIVPKSARRWIYHKQKQKDWPTWEQILQVNMVLFCIRKWLLELLPKSKQE